MTTCTECNKGDMRKDKRQKNAKEWCTNMECKKSFYQTVIIRGEK